MQSKSRIEKTLLLKQYLGKCFCNKKTPTEMFFISTLKICQMYSFSIYAWKFKNICKNLWIYPWLKAIFRKSLRCGFFPGNFSQYLTTALPSKSYTLRWLLWIELYTVISFHYCTDFFLCSEEQGDYYSILLYNGMQKLFKIDHLPYSSDRKLCCSSLFLKNWDFRKNSHKNLWNCEQRRGYCEAVRKLRIA